MSWVQVGACPKCGAPIYTEAVSMSVLPPAPRYSCLCVPQPRIVTATTTSGPVVNG